MKSIYVYPTHGKAIDFHGDKCEVSVLFGGTLLVVCSETEQHAWSQHAWHSYTVMEKEDV